MYPEKLALVIRNDLPTWQKLNVASFLASSVAIAYPQTHGKPFVNKTSMYLPFIKHPILIYKAETQEQLNRAFTRAKERDVALAIYTKGLFATKNEEDNLLEIAKYTDDEQELVGIALYGESKKVDKSLDGLRFHE